MLSTNNILSTINIINGSETNILKTQVMKGHLRNVSKCLSFQNIDEIKVKCNLKEVPYK